MMVINIKSLSSEFSKFIFSKWRILVIIFFGLTPILWFKAGLTIMKGDNFPFISPLLNLPRNLYAWSALGGLGGPAQAGSVSLPQTIWMSIWYGLNGLGVPINIVQILLQIFYFLGSGFIHVFSSLNHL